MDDAAIKTVPAMKMSLIARLKLRFAPEKEIDDIKSILSKRPIKDKGIFNRLW